MKYIIAIGLLICGFCFGVYYGQAVYEPKVITKVVTITKIEVVEVEIFTEQKPFPSLRSLQIWQARNYIKDTKSDECVDDALELQRRALEDGYLMSTELWGDGLREGHMICSAVIGDKIYFLEPTNTMSWLAGYKK